MKKLVAIITAIALIVVGINFTPKHVDAAVLSSQGSSSWNLVWSDEFNQATGSSVNSDYWQFDLGHGSDGWGNKELQNYTNSTENVRILDVDGAVDGKALAITAKRSNGEITSGRIKTLDKQYVKYGKIEARIRTVNGMQSGVWPAFWMMGNDINSVAWPNCGELDIMEHRNAEQQIISTLHWNPNADSSYAHVYEGSETNGQFGRFDSMDSWHVYAVEWYEDCMKFYLDGNHYETLTLTEAMKEEFHKPHFILLNLAIGSNQSPFTLNQTVSDNWTESSMYVDYVRLYQGTDANFYRALSSDTSQVITTAAPPSPTDGMTQCAVDTWTAAGDVWDYNIAKSWLGAEAYYSGGSQNDLSIYLSNSPEAAWGAMIRANQSVIPGHTYSYTINYTSTAAGSVLVKEDVGPSAEQTVNINNGSGTVTGSFTANANQTNAQILMDLRGIKTGTKLTITGLTLTDTTGNTEEPSDAETTTVASGSTEWKSLGEGYSYDTENTVKEVVSIQQPDWSAEKGIYMNVPAAISSVSVNGVTENVATIDGAGVVVFLSALTKNINEVVITYAGGTGTLTIKNDNVTEEPTTEPPTVEETTTAPSQVGTNGSVRIEGFQISTTEGGSRVVGSVEPTINGKDVANWGLIYGLESYTTTSGTIVNNISDSDMVVDSSNNFVQSYQSTSVGTLNAKMGDSTTATYFARTMLFGQMNTSAFTATYKVRAYAVLSDGSYVYSDVASYSVYDVANKLYQNQLMNTFDGHEYLYNTILKTVTPDYNEVDYQWSNTIVGADKID